MSNLLTDVELASMRDSIEAVALPDTCNLLTMTRTADGEGGGTEAWGTATTNVACRLDPSGYQSGKATVADSVQSYDSWTLSVPYDTTLTSAMHVEHGSDTYSVVSVNSDASWLLVKRAFLQRI